MFSCLYNYSRSRSTMRHHPLRDREREKGGQGSFVSFSEEKETKDSAAFFSFAPSVPPFPSFPPTPPSPSCSPPDPDPSLPLLHIYERKRSGLHNLPPSLTKMRQRSVRRPSPWHRCPRRSPRSPPTPPATTPSDRMCALLLDVPHGLIVVFSSFYSIPRAPFALRPLFRCAVRRSTADDPRTPRSRG